MQLQGRVAPGITGEQGKSTKHFSTQIFEQTPHFSNKTTRSTILA